MNDAVRFRTAAALILVAAAAVANVVRLLVASDQSTLDVPGGIPVVVLLLLAYEASVLLWLHAGNHTRPLPT